MKPATNIHHVSWHCGKGFQGLWSKVEVIGRPNAVFQLRYINCQFVVEDRLVFLFSAALCE